MKILLDIIQGASGSNIWTQRLCNNLNRSGIDADIRSFPFWYQFVPLMRTRILKDQNSIVQHTNSWSGWSLKTGLPQVITEHTAVHQPFLGKYKTAGQKVYHDIIRRYEAKSIRSADEVVCVSRFAQKSVEDLYGFSDSRLIYNGVDPQVFQPVIIPDNPYRKRGDKIHILYTGNLTALKGADLLPGIMDLLDDHYTLLVVQGFRQKLRIPQKRIVFLGMLPENELVKVYNACDIFIAPSRVEGFGLTVAEAMACGKPVIATNGSSLPELVIDGKGGFLCEMDNVQEFADRIRYLAGEPGERERMGRFNRQRIEEMFTLDRMAGNYIGVYKSLI